MWSLSLLFFLVPPLIVSALDGMDELYRQMMVFHVEPTKANFDRIQELMKKNLDALAQKENDRKALRIAIFLARVKEKYSWDIADIGSFDDLAREISQGSSDLARYVNRDDMVDPLKLDIWWRSYFATGDDKYLTKLLEQTGDLDDLKKMEVDSQEDRDLFLKRVVLMSVANGSVKFNCQHFPSVLQHVKKAVAYESNTGRKRFLEECIQSVGKDKE